MVLCRPGGRCFYFSLTFFFLLLFVVLSSFFGFSSYDLQVCGQPFVRMLGRLEKKEIKDLAFFFFCESILCLSGFTFLYFWILYSCGNQMDTLFL